MPSVRYTPQQKAAAAFRVLVGGETITRVAADVGTTRKSLSGWVKSANVQRMVREMRAAKSATAAPSPAKPPAEAANDFEAADLLPDVTRQRLRMAILKPIPLAQALALCRLSPDADDRWGELADAGDEGARMLLLDIRQWSAQAICDLTDAVREGNSAGKGSQWLLSRLWRDLYGESVEDTPERNAIEAYSDAELAAIAAQGTA